MAISISSSIMACLKSFNEFIEEINHLQRANVVGLVINAWEDELGRLRMWAANIGAHQTGQSSLDFRLRDASHVRDQIIKLLRGLVRRLQDARSVLADDEEPDDEEVADDLLDEDDPKTELQELQESLATKINCLFQMSMLVRKPASHDVYMGSKRADVAVFEPFDYHYVKHKYPKADDGLVKRLGSAITRRRKYLKYRERHATKLRQGLILEGREMDFGTRSALSDTVATVFQPQINEFDDRASDMGFSQTSYAPTLLSSEDIIVPPPPQSSLAGAPFECPYCFYIIEVDGTRSWTKHVFRDLQPYICLATSCPTPNKLYTTKHEWLHHSSMIHPAAIFDSNSPKESQGSVTCPLCKAENQLGTMYDGHLARHLQELALSILPGCEEDPESFEKQDAGSTSSGESVILVASQDFFKLLDQRPTFPNKYSVGTESLVSLHEEQEGEDDSGKKYSKDEEYIHGQGSPSSSHHRPRPQYPLSSSYNSSSSYQPQPQHATSANQNLRPPPITTGYPDSGHGMDRASSYSAVTLSEDEDGTSRRFEKEKTKGLIEPIEPPWNRSVHRSSEQEQRTRPESVAIRHPSEGDEHDASSTREAYLGHSRRKSQDEKESARRRDLSERFNILSKELEELAKRMERRNILDKELAKRMERAAILEKELEERRKT